MAIPPISFDHDKNKGDNYHLNILYMQYKRDECMSTFARLLDPPSPPGRITASNGP